MWLIRICLYLSWTMRQRVRYAIAILAARLCPSKRSSSAASKWQRASNTRIITISFTALAKDPRDRFISVQAFAYALERASQISEREDHDHGSRQTAPLTQKTTSRQEVYLAAVAADETFAARLKADLEHHGVVFWRTPP